VAIVPEPSSLILLALAFSAVAFAARIRRWADGFYEWRTEGKAKLPFRIHRPDDSLFAFAGLWEHWDGDEKPIESCTIVTTEANSRLSTIHDRMPVIFTTPTEFEQWLTAPDAKTLMRPLPDDALEVAAANRYVNNSRHEGPECIAPVV
jgi:putative SOS response-associated peptidase YedK